MVELACIVSILSFPMHSLLNRKGDGENAVPSELCIYSPLEVVSEYSRPRIHAAPQLLQALRRVLSCEPEIQPEFHRRYRSNRTVDPALMQHPDVARVLDRASVYQESDQRRFCSQIPSQFLDDLTLKRLRRQLSQSSGCVPLPYLVDVSTDYQAHRTVAVIWV